MASSCVHSWLWKKGKKNNRFLFHQHLFFSKRCVREFIFFFKYKFWLKNFYQIIWYLTDIKAIFLCGAYAHFLSCLLKMIDLRLTFEKLIVWQKNCSFNKSVSFCYMGVLIIYSIGEATKKLWGHEISESHMGVMKNHDTLFSLNFCEQTRTFINWIFWPTNLFFQ